MLNLIRDNVQSFGVKFIVGIVVIVMSFFGVSAYRSQSSNTIVTVDGYEVKIDKFSRAFENAREDIRQRYGNRASDYLNMINLESQIIKQLTSNALLLKSAEQNGLAVSDKELAHEIYTNPSFMTDERFDPYKYETNLGYMNTDKIGFEKDLKESLLSQKFLRFVATGALVSRKSLEEEFRRYESKMTVKAIEFTPELFTNQANLTEKEIEDYYELHKSDFQQKSQFDLDYFVLSIEDVQGKINVRPKEVKKYYENNVTEEFTNKASFHSRHILIRVPQGAAPDVSEQARMKADSLHKQLLKNPTSFASLATIHSEDPGSAKKGGDLGWVDEGSFVAEFEAQVAAMETDEISRPFKSNFGFHIVQVLGKKAATKKPFEEVKAEIEDTMRKNKAKRRLANLVKKLLNKEGEVTLAELAQEVNKTVGKTGDFDENKELKDIGYSYQLYQEVKEKTINQKGQHKLAGDEKIVVYQVTNSKEPFVKPLSEVKDRVRYYAKEEKKTNLAKQKLNDYAASVKDLEAFKNVARSLNTKITDATFKFSDRQVSNLNVTNRFKSEAFRMEKNQTKAIQDGNRNYLVFMIDKQKGELTDISREQLAGLETMMQNQKSQLVLNSLITKMQSDIDIDYNMPLLNAMNVNLEL